MHFLPEEKDKSLWKNAKQFYKLYDLTPGRLKSLRRQQNNYKMLHEFH